MFLAARWSEIATSMQADWKNTSVPCFISLEIDFKWSSYSPAQSTVGLWAEDFELWGTVLKPACSSWRYHDWLFPKNNWVILELSLRYLENEVCVLELWMGIEISPKLYTDLFSFLHFQCTFSVWYIHYIHYVLFTSYYVFMYVFYIICI